MKRNGGITLIALVVTVVVLMILAGVSITMLTGESGIINQAKEAQRQTEYSGEEDLIQMAIVEAKAKAKNGEMTREDLKRELDTNFGEGNYEIEEEDERYVITVKNSKNKEEHYVEKEEIVLGESDIEFDYDPKDWTSESVEVTAISKIKGYTIQISRDGEKWETKDKLTYEENGPVYAKLIKDGQYSKYISGEVTNIDRENPTAEIELTGKGTVETATVQATVTHADGIKQSGVKTMKYELNTDSEKLGLEEASYTKTFSNNGEQLTLSVSTEDKAIYYLHVLTIDGAKNATETISKAITVIANKHTHIGNKTTQGGCYTEPVYHTHKGNDTVLGGCYTKPVYHKHTGSSTSGGGCYGNGRHVHNNGCYGSACGCCSGDGSGIHDTTSNCSVCGHDGGHRNPCPERPLICGNGPNNTFSLVCGKSTEDIIGYSLGCEKDENTIEEYSLSCGKSEGIESYTISY